MTFLCKESSYAQRVKLVGKATIKKTTKTPFFYSFQNPPPLSSFVILRNSKNLTVSERKFVGGAGTWARSAIDNHTSVITLLKNGKQKQLSMNVASFRCVLSILQQAEILALTSVIVTVL